MTIEKLRRPAQDAGREAQTLPRADPDPGGESPRAIMDALPHAVIELAADGISVGGFNRALRDLASGIAGCAAGTPWLELFHPDDRASLAAAYGDASQTAAGGVWRHVARLGCDADARWVLVAGRNGGDGAEASRFLSLADVHDVQLPGPPHARAQRNDRFLLALEDELRALGAGVDVRRIAARRLAEFLSVHRCAYAIVDGDEDHAEVDQDYARPGIGSVVGRYRLTDFGAATVDALRHGRAVVVDDVGSDPRFDRDTRAVYRRYDVRALVCVPLQRAGRLVAAMAIHCAEARRWREDEIALVHAVSHRCWESLERARAESERRAGDARFRALVEGAAQIVWSTDADGRVVEPLPSWCAFTGQTAARAMGEGWVDAVHPDDRERFRRLWRQALESARAFEGEFRVQHAQAGWRWMRARGHPVMGDDGTVREWIGMNVDVSERKRIERRDAFLVRLDDAVRSLSDPEEVATSVARLLGEHLQAQRVTYLEVDPDEHVFTVVRDHAPGLPELRGRTFRLDEFGSGAGEALRGGRGFLAPDPGIAEGSALVGGQEAEAPDPNRSAVLMVPLFRDRRLAAVLGLVRLMPRQWQEEEIDLARAVIHRGWESIERARLARDLRLADERKDEFIAMLAHELRNPLAPLRNGLQVLRRGPADVPAERVHRMMERQVDQLVRLVDDLLDVSRITRGKMELRMEPQSLSRILTVSMETARPLIDARRHRLEVDVPGDEIRVRGDAVRLAQIFANLLNNAARYTDDGGSIVLRARREGTRAVVSVRDSGIGLAAEMCERVFETFEQVARGPNDLNSGLGIGLSLARSLTLLHDGRISAHSEGLGRGSEFVVSLPLIDTPKESAHGDAAAADHDGTALRTALRVLVVDDNQDAADAFGTLLEVLGAEVRVCYRAVDAMAEFEREVPEIAFLDLGMPEINGYELARRIRQHPRGRDLRLVALTGWGKDSDRQRSRDAGFDHHLVKPVNLDVLESVLSSPDALRPR
ncbi:MAG: hypothetical protein K0Q76_1650 [Panacagrimonas sp.]|jgi:PAS domain S-box-containing protein|nr:GAF domain-containing protein [Panacagrimonas sp.]MCC2656542.1 hypothetical protein [Panacagrimonas sp.]